MRKFEYRPAVFLWEHKLRGMPLSTFKEDENFMLIVRDDEPAESAMHKVLNDLGAQGWEAYSVVSIETGSFFYLRREIPQS